MKHSLLPQPSTSPHLKSLLLSAILAATPGIAAAQFKCVDKAGNIVLTDLACPGRNTRGPSKAERSNPAGTTEDMQQAIGAGNSNSATAPKSSVPPRAQPLDAVNEKPPTRKPASPV